MASTQGESFQEIIQRYNRELLRLQRKAYQEAPQKEPPDFPETKAAETGAASKEDNVVDYFPDILGKPQQPEPPQELPQPEPPPPEPPQEPPQPPQERPPMIDDTDIIEPPSCSEGMGLPDFCFCPPRPKPPEFIPPDSSGCAVQAPCSQTVGTKGPVLLQDTMLHETLSAFVESTSLSRPIHAKGWGAAGRFSCTHSMKAYTMAGFLQHEGESTPVQVRFSQAAGDRGAPDTTRNIRGFSVKFYTRTGNFDLLCNSIPVFFVRDPMQFPEAAAALAPSPASHLPDPQRLWAFLARTPEALHMFTWYYSDVGTVRSYRTMRGFGVNAFVWKNAAGERHYVKYHWIPLAGEQYAAREEAELMAADPNALGRDLFERIAGGNPVEYELRVQLMDLEDRRRLSFDPLDATKVWDENLYPLLPVGKLTLDQNPENYEEQVEKLAFSPANLVEGIELSEDRILQGRTFPYWDSQRRRLGKDFREIPVNRSLSGEWSPGSLTTSGEGEAVSGDLLRQEIHNPENFLQAGEHYRAMTSLQKEHLIDNMASELYQVSGMIQSCVIGYLYQADPELGTRTQRMIEAYSKRR